MKSQEKPVVIQVSALDQEWAEMCAGKKLTRAQVLEFKRDYARWIQEQEITREQILG